MFHVTGFNTFIDEGVDAGIRPSRQDTHKNLIIRFEYYDDTNFDSDCSEFVRVDNGPVADILRARLTITDQIRRKNRSQHRELFGNDWLLVAADLANDLGLVQEEMELRHATSLFN